MLVVGAEAVLTQAPTLNCPTIGGGYAEPGNGFKDIALGHRKSAESLWRRRQQTKCVILKESHAYGDVDDSL